MFKFGRHSATPDNGIFNAQISRACAETMPAATALACIGLGDDYTTMTGNMLLTEQQIAMTVVDMCAANLVS
jgi:hypothetical protein